MTTACRLFLYLALVAIYSVVLLTRTLQQSMFDNMLQQAIFDDMPRNGLVYLPDTLQETTATMTGASNATATATTEKLSIFIITMFYGFLEQRVDDMKLAHRFRALKYFTSENIKLIRDSVDEDIEWIIVTQPKFKPMFNWSELSTEATIVTNPFPRRQKFEYDEYELDRGGKYPFLRNRLPHLTISIDSDDCMNLQYVKNVLEHVNSGNITDELHLFYTGSCYAYNPCNSRSPGAYHDRFNPSANGTENYSMGIALLNNSTNNMLNAALYGHGGPPSRFPHMGYTYGVTGINIPGLYVQTPFSHSRGFSISDQQLQKRDCEFARAPVHDGIFWNAGA